MELQVVLGLPREARGRGPRPRPRRGPGPPPRRHLRGHRRRGGGRLPGHRLDRRQPARARPGRRLPDRGRRRQRRDRADGASTRSRPPRRATTASSITVHGTAGHASIPRADNAAGRGRRVLDRLGPAAVDARDTAHGPRHQGRPGRAARRTRRQRRSPAIDPGRAGSSARSCATRSARPSSSGGNKDNIIPGTATIIIDCRILPGTTEASMEAELRERIGEDSGEPAMWSRRSSASRSSSRCPTRSSTSASRRSCAMTPTACPSRSWSPSRPTPSTPRAWASPPMASRRSGSMPTSPSSSNFHSDDERIGLDALRFGLPVLDEVVRRYCG